MFVITLTTKQGFAPMQGEIQTDIVFHIAGDGIRTQSEVEEIARQLQYVLPLLEPTK